MTSGVVRDHSLSAAALAANMQHKESSHEIVTSEVRPNDNEYLQEKKYKHKRFKRFRSLLLHRGRVNGLRSEEAGLARQTAGSRNEGAPPAEGLCGITNHGNTCYMNAVLQCLANTDQLAQRLVLDNFSAGARPASCLKGDITEQMALLMGLLWSNMDTPPISLDLYRLMCRYAPQYYGNGQHDAQEFLLWLLNTLEEEISKSALSANKRVVTSNDNLIRQLFWGQFKSTIKCLNCQYESITFEPYSCISLPIPHQEVHAVLVSVIFRNSVRNRKFGIFLDGLTLVKQLRATVSSLSGLHEECIMLVDLHGSELGRVFHDEQRTLIVNGRHLYAMEVPIGAVKQPTIDHRNGKEVLLIYAVNCCGSLRDGKWFGLPMIFRVHRDLTHYMFQSVLLKAISKHIRKEVDMFKVWHDMLFQCRLLDAVPSKCVPLTNYHSPFYMPAVQRALQECQQQGVTPHLKLILEWEQPVVASVFGTLLDVAISEDDSVSHVCSRMFQSQVTTLENCLQLYTQRELLSSDDVWTCSNCQQPQNGAGKKISLWNVPDVLILHLKRFKQVGVVRAKLRSLVEFPVNGLDMNPYLEKKNMSKSCSSLPRDGFTPDPTAMLSRTPSQLLSNESGPEKVKRNKKTFGTTLKRKLARSSNSASTLRPTSQNGIVQVDNNIYDLYAVCNHMGNMNSGHYTAFCCNPSNGCWYSYNDNQVDLIRENTHLITKSAYMLFYIRRTARHDNYPHWSSNIAKNLLLSAVANRSPGYLLGGSRSAPPKRKLDSTSSLPAGPILPSQPTRMGAALPGRIHSASAMILPSGPMTTSRQFSPQLSTVGEGSSTLNRYQARMMSSDDVAYAHQKTTSLIDQTVTSPAATEYHRRSKSFDSPKHQLDWVSPARSEAVRDKAPEWTGYCSRTLPTGHRGKGNGALHLPHSGTETCV